MRIEDRGHGPAFLGELGYADLKSVDMARSCHWSSSLATEASLPSTRVTQSLPSCRGSGGSTTAASRRMARHGRRLRATGACRLHAGTIRILYEVDDEAAVISSSTSRPSP